jgi:flagellar basal-body rod protein FlgF
MIRGLYAAAKSMTTGLRKMDVLANNIANADTTGYKRDTIVTGPFTEVLISRLGEQAPGINMDTFNGVTFDSHNGRMTVQADGAYLIVMTPRGNSFCRAVCLEADQQGYLVTTSGNHVLGNNGRILVGDAQRVTIDPMGNVYAAGQLVDKLRLYNAPGIIGTLNGGACINQVATDTKQGNMTATGCPTNLAVKGQGYFTVSADGRERYTRDGSFVIDSLGYLVSADGFSVIGQNGPIWLGQRDVYINEMGEIYRDGRLVDRLKLVRFEDRSKTIKIGNNLYSVEDSTYLVTDNDSQVLQGFLEGSNVNVVKEMINMITALRAYESNQKVVTAYDETMGKAVNELGRV